MKITNKFTRSELIKLIHTGARLRFPVDPSAQGKDQQRDARAEAEAARRRWQYALVGHESCATATTVQLEQLVEDLRRSGHLFQRGAAGDDRQAKLIYALWRSILQQGHYESHARVTAFIQRQTGKHAKPEWLTQAEKNKVIEALKAIDRRGPPTHSNPLEGASHG